MDYKSNVTVKIDGIAASAASVIAMAGTSVLMAPTALMMVHNPLTIAIGDSEEMQKAMEMLAEVKESIINAYQIKSNQSRAKISHWMDAETWMNANRAIELGFADGVLEDSKHQKPADEVTFAFSRRAVTNSLLDKVIPKTKPKQSEMSQGVQLSRLKSGSHSSNTKYMEVKTMSTILELREKRNKIWNTAKAFLDSKRGAGRSCAARIRSRV